MWRFSIHLPRTLGAVLLAAAQMSCSSSTVGPIPPAGEAVIFADSFEHNGTPTLEGWRLGNPSLTTLEQEPAPGGGRWGLGLEADWAPTTGFIAMPIPGIRNGDVLRLSAYVRAVDSMGGGSIGLSVGPGFLFRGSREKVARTTSTSWTLLTVQDTISLAPGDTVWVSLSSLNTELLRRDGRFDLVQLSRLATPGAAQMQ